MKVKKYFGQHWLIDQNICDVVSNKIIKERDKNQIILEIGPGKGAITKYLYEKIKQEHLYLVEIDKFLINDLKKKFPSLNHIFNIDILKFDFSKFKSPIFLCGNLPYNISNQIFFKIFENKSFVDKAVCMVQKEVGERICSKPNNKKYGILSVLLQLYYNIEKVIEVDPVCFDPPPKVQSTVIYLNRNTRKSLDNEDEKKITKLVKMGFNTRRKKLKNSLFDLNISGSIYENLRAENLSADDFLDLYHTYSKK